MANGQPSTPEVVVSVFVGRFVGGFVGGVVVVAVFLVVGVGEFVSVIVAGVEGLVVVMFVLVVVPVGGSVVEFFGVSVDAELVIPAFRRAQVCFTHMHDIHQLLPSERTGG